MSALYPWEIVVEETFDSGVRVWLRPVPPYASMDVHLKLPPPPLPKVEIQSVAGHTETKTVLPGTAEYDTWRATKQAHEKATQMALMNFDLDYCVVQWQFPGQDKPETKVPPSWVVPPTITKWGVVTKEMQKRAAFIKYALIQTTADDQKVSVVIMTGKPVAKAELKAALVPTESPDEDSQ